MSAFTFKDVLLKAASFVEQGWCRDYAAINHEGQGTHPASHDAVAWCASGAITRAHIDLEAHELCAPEANLWLAVSLGFDDVGMIPRWNDSPVRTAHEVAEAMRRAAE